jgi:hypothetical protein
VCSNQQSGYVRQAAAMNLDEVWHSKVRQLVVNKTWGKQETSDFDSGAHLAD